MNSSGYQNRAGQHRGARGVAAALMATAGLVMVLAQPAAAASTPLVGTFTITAGSCSGGAPSGTYLRMVLSGGSNASGPYFSNSDSSCSDNSYTPLSSGSAGGLVTGSYQPQPSPAFDAAGNALANQITAPVPFEGVKFATSTNPTDPQTGLKVPVPSISVIGTSLSGDLTSFGVSWNKQEFNQGSPKPDGSSPANTTPVVGTYNPASGAYTLQWSSQVVGGPFNGFSAFWNLTGRFIPASSTPNPTSSAGSGATGSPGQTSVGGSGTQGGPTQGTGAATGNGGGSVPSATAGSTGGATPGKSAGSGSSGGSPEPKNQGNVALSSHTTTSGQGGWHSPVWLVLLVILLGVLGLAGVLWSERALRHPRAAAVHTEGD